MVLAARRFTDDLCITPTQTPEVIGECDASETGRGGRSAAFADGDVILNPKRQRKHRHALGFENLAVGCENEMIFQSLADFFVASGGVNRKAGGAAGANCDVKIHRQSGRIESRAQVRRGCRKGEM
jgi:hypothetical protein